MVKKVGILLDSMEASDKLIYLGGQAAYASINTDILIFYLNISKLSMQIPVAFMDSSECFSFDGECIATCLNTAETLLSFPGPTQKFLYVWDLEWMHDVHPHERLSKIYNNPEIKLIARNQRDYDILKKEWNEPTAIVENFKFGW